jgi:hypothetical protein
MDPAHTVPNRREAKCCLNCKHVLGLQFGRTIADTEYHLYCELLQPVDTTEYDRSLCPDYPDEVGIFEEYKHEDGKVLVEPNADRVYDYEVCDSHSHK